MKTKLIPIPRTLAVGAATLLFAAFTPLRAQTDLSSDSPAVAAQQFDAAATAQGDAKATALVSGHFAQFAGSDENAQALVTGLRDGSAITLASTANNQTTTTTIKPATGKMGYGNVFLSLALAQQELAKAGIKNPTPEQLQAALNGGTITTGTGDKAVTTQLAGVLKLRADGQGWGDIAKTLDVKLGRVVSSLRSAHKHLERPDRPEKPDKPEKIARPDHPDRPDHPQRPERPEPPARPMKPERPERPSH